VAVAEEVALVVLAAAVVSEYVIVHYDDNNGDASHNGDACEMVMADGVGAVAAVACPAQLVTRPLLLQHLPVQTES